MILAAISARLSHFSMQAIVSALALLAVYATGLKILPAKPLTRSNRFPPIPAVGIETPVLCYCSAILFFFRGAKLVQEAYGKHKNGRGVFKVPDLSGWHYLIASPTLVSEFLETKEHDLSLFEGIADVFEAEHILDVQVHGPSMNLAPLRSYLSRMEREFDNIYDETVHACADLLPSTAEWGTITGYIETSQLIARVLNRIIVGVPICRNPRYISSVIQFAASTIKASIVLKFVPSRLRPLFIKVFGTSRDINGVMQCIEGSVKERLGAQMPAQTDDLLDFIIKNIPENARSLRTLAIAILLVNFGGIHTTTSSLLHAMYRLAASPEEARILRKEAQETVAKYGWNKVSLSKMRCMDSFLREIHRFYGTAGSATMVRKARKDVIFSDGTFVPKGSLVSVVEYAVNHDASMYEHPDTFKPWRFLPGEHCILDLERVPTDKAHDTLRQSKFINTSSRFLAFGHGKHACPGRFFAGTALKTILAHILLNYDLKSYEPDQASQPFSFGLKSMPNPFVKVLLRRREDASDPEPE